METINYQDSFILTLRKGQAPRTYIWLSKVTIWDEWGNMVFSQRFGEEKEISVYLRKGSYNISVSCLGGLLGKRVESQLVLQDYQQPQCDITIDIINRNYVAQYVPFMAYLTTPFDYRLRFSDSKQPVRASTTRRGLAKVLVALAVFIMAFAFAVTFFSAMSSASEIYPGADIYLEGTDAFTKITYEYVGAALSNILVWILVVIIALGLFRIADILRKRRAHTSINPEVRKPYCLYLRSFNSDRMTGKEISSFLKPGQTEESLLVDIFNEIAPVYAIGCPNEKYLPKGADRLYVSDEEWKEKVQELARDAEVILLRLGETDGFWWEVEHCFQNIDLQRLVFIIPATHNVDIISMLYAKLMARGLIDQPVHTDISRRSKTHISGFLYFDENNRPVFQKLEHSRLAAVVVPLGDKIQQLLRPFLMRFRLIVPKKKLTQRVIAGWAAILLAIGFVAAVKVSQVVLFQYNRYPREVISACEQVPAIRAEFAKYKDNDNTKFYIIAKSADAGAVLLSDEAAVDFFNLQCELIISASDRELEIIYDFWYSDEDLSEELLKAMLTVAKQYLHQEYYEAYVSYLTQCSILCFEHQDRGESFPTVSQEDWDKLIVKAVEYAPGWANSDVPTQSEKKEFLLALFAAGIEMYEENPERIDIIKLLLVCP